MQFHEVDYRSLNDEQIRSLNELENAIQADAYPEDPPKTFELTAVESRNQPDYLDIRQHWAMDPSGALAAHAYLYWRDVAQNRHVADLVIEVHPERRRRGIARELLRLLAEVAEAEGRTLLIARTSERVPAGEAFARRIGAQPGMAHHTNRLMIDGLDTALVRRWIDDGPRRAPDYELEAIDGRIPDASLEEVVDLTQVMNTAPRGDLDVEDNVMTPLMYRQWEQGIDADGTQRWTLFARHRPTGELAGYTAVYWNPHQPKTLFQGDTGVRPEHRGHALGKWLKAAMLERMLIELSDIDDIRTGNADSNEAMLAINRALGFEPYIASTFWQTRLPAVRRYLDSV